MPPRDERPADVRFWDLVDRTDDCWMWRGPVQRQCLPFFNLAHSPTRVRLSAVRYAWQLEGRALEANEYPHSMCGERLCVRPDHRRAGTTGDAERYTEASRLTAFWSHVERLPGDGCWEWSGSRFLRSGYGRFFVRGNSVLAHRFAWELEHGRPVPEGLFVCHRCDNPPCVRPDHLFAGSPAQNSADMTAKGRQAKLGGVRAAPAKLTAEQVREIRTRYVPRVVTHRMLAEEYGVSRTAIGSVVRGLTY